MADYDIVLLIEEELSDRDAAQVVSLSEGHDEPVVYHVLMPAEDAAAQLEASMGSLAGGEVLAAPSLGLDDVDLAAIREDAMAENRERLKKTVDRLERAGATVASSRLVETSPISALAAVVGEVDGREAIILTRPHVVKEFFGLDWTSQARRKIGVPVLHLLERETFDDQAGGGEGVTGA